MTALGSRYSDHLFDFEIQQDDVDMIMNSPPLFPSLSRIFSWKKRNPAEPFSMNGFQVAVDVQSYSPQDITVKTNKHDITIEGQHKEKEDIDHGFVSRHFIRRYSLPKTYDLETVQSSFTTDGVLTVKAAPPKENEQKDIDRVVPVEVKEPKKKEVIRDPDEDMIFNMYE